MPQGDLKKAKELLENTNKTVKEIADETGCNVGTLRTYKHQALNEKRNVPKVKQSPSKESNTFDELNDLKRTIKQQELEKREMSELIEKLKGEIVSQSDVIVLKAEVNLYRNAWLEHIRTMAEV